MSSSNFVGRISGSAPLKTMLFIGLSISRAEQSTSISRICKRTLFRCCKAPADRGIILFSQNCVPRVSLIAGLYQIYVYLQKKFPIERKKDDSGLVKELDFGVIRKLHDSSFSQFPRVQPLGDPGDYTAHRLVSQHRPSDSFSFSWLIIRVRLYDRRNKWIPSFGRDS